jgi:glutamine phosphoribosylpyrophosphate amidotransferase
MKTECGIIGTFTENPITKEELYNTLSKIQHRGQDSYGYVTMKTKTILENKIEKIEKIENESESHLIIIETKEKGLLPEINKLDIDLYAVLFLGHMRYSTNTITENLDTSLVDCNLQPVEISKKHGIYIAHNGNLPNLKENMKRLGLGNKYKDGMSDTYLFRVIWNHLYGNYKGDIGIKDILEYLKYILLHIIGAYSCVLTFYDSNIYSGSNESSANNSLNSSQEESLGGSGRNRGHFYLFGIRDRYGYKPLSMAKIGDNYCFISESVQLPKSRDYARDVNPGEIWMLSNDDRPLMIGRISGNGIGDKVYICALEVIYFMKRDTILFNGETTVNNFRRRLGLELGKKDIDALLTYDNRNRLVGDYEAIQELKKKDVLYMPESAHSIALGYSELIGSRLREDLIFKVENIRSFIESTTEAREGKLQRKFAFNDMGIAELKEIVLIDDTIVRGNSMKYIVGELYKRNPELKIHIRIGSPRIVKGCSFGIDLYDDELIATNNRDLVQYLGNGVVSVEFLNMETLYKVFERYGMNNCEYCFGNVEGFNKKTLEW